MVNYESVNRFEGSGKFTEILVPFPGELIIEIVPFKGSILKSV
jgi:hypothetical protein